MPARGVVHHLAEPHPHLLAELARRDLTSAAVSGNTPPDPTPDAFLRAAEGLSLHPAQCLAVCDTPAGVNAARRAGLTAIAVGHAAPGARVRFATEAELADDLDRALAACAPQRFDLTPGMLHELLAPAFAAARDNLADGGAPIAAALYDAEGRLLAVGANQSHKTGNPLHHAEIVLLNSATGRFDPAARDTLLACTLEPCVMCTGAAMESGIETLLWALNAPADSGSWRVTPPASPESITPRTVGGVRAEESRELFREFLRQTKNPQQAAFVRQLLSLT